MKAFIYLSICMLTIISIDGRAQYVTLEGKQFKLNGNNFYPMVLNYQIEQIKDGSNYYIARQHYYGQTDSFECFDSISSSLNIQEDFNYIAGMGFNTVRITGFGPKYDTSTKRLFCEYATYNQGDSSYFIDPLILNDPGIARLIPLYKKILQIANSTFDSITQTLAPLKIIFILTGKAYSYSDTIKNLYNDFFNVLAGELASDTNGGALLAYDLMNEPCLCLPRSMTKEKTCELFSTWSGTIKSQDTNHLVTSGFCTFDVWNADPTIMNVDFLSLHTYPYWNKDFEDQHTSNQIMQRGWDRTAAEMFWLNRTSALPWMIGENGLSAEDSKPFGIIPDASENDQLNYASFALNTTCNCGGSGYSWFGFQDNNDDTLNNFHDEFLGLLYSGNRSVFPSTKPVVNNVFKTYSSPTSVSSCGPCPVIYSPSYDSSLIYYNPFQHPANPTLTIKGTIIDQDGNPIKDAVIGGHTDIYDYGTPGPNSAGDDDMDYHITLSDSSGYFELIPYDYLPPYNDPGTIITLYISAAGAERKKYGIWGSNPFPSDPVPAPNSNFTLILNRINYNYNGNLNNITIPSGVTRNLKGGNSLTTSNITIQPTASSDIFARNEVHLLDSLAANKGSVVHIYCAPPSSDCPDFSSYLMEYRQSNIPHEQNFEIEKEIELTFAKLSVQNTLIVSPNPSTGQFNIRLVCSELSNIASLKICNIIGENIISLSLNSPSAIIDLSTQPKGVYYLRAETSSGTFIQKIIVQ